MAKTKKEIQDFKDALSSNTEFLNEDNFEDEVLFGHEKKGDSVVSIDRIAFRKFKILAAHSKRSTTEVIHEALDHYLRVKKMALEQAMLDLTKED